ncbi:MAG TPA: citramalate synthase [Spirochaetales bacterium]|nr:citramalate synthase [Spirochaetales bacterium]HRY55316.1 citramalate synthase [Spirochaetia bacterium]HRZ64329.1 citramalate synthase [Spirochaetia bacterium]
MERVELLDTTLRDGAQCEGVSFSVRDKIEVARALAELGVDLIEAGNPGSNPKDMEFFERARGLELGPSRLAAFGPTRRKLAAAGEDEGLRSLLAAGTGTVVVFGKSSPLHVIEVLGTSLAENLAMIEESVAFLRSRGRRVVYDAEHYFDACAADEAYALETLRAAARGGAEVLVLCDTNGGSLPGTVSAIAARALAAVGAPIGIHAHDDSGLALANTLAAVGAGAVHAQGTLIGLGERCGNANLAVAACCLELKLGRPCLAEGALPRLYGAVRRVAEIANVGLHEGMPFVGRRAFAHKAGMHVDAVAKLPASFEHVAPELVGNERRFLASEVGGRTTLVDRMRAIEPGATKDSPSVARALARLKAMEAEGYQYEGAEASLELLLRDSAGERARHFELDHYRTIGEEPSKEGGGKARARAMVKVLVGGAEEIGAAEGVGPVHALDLALRKALKPFFPAVEEVRLVDYKVRVIDSADATAAKVRVLIESADSREAWTTVGVSSDVIEASRIALAESIEYKLQKDGVAAEAASRE